MMTYKQTISLRDSYYLKTIGIKCPMLLSFLSQSRNGQTRFGVHRNTCSPMKHIVNRSLNDIKFKLEGDKFDLNKYHRATSRLMDAVHVFLEYECWE